MSHSAARSQPANSQLVPQRALAATGGLIHSHDSFHRGGARRALPGRFVAETVGGVELNGSRRGGDVVTRQRNAMQKGSANV